MSKRGAIFDNENALAANRSWIIHEKRGGGFDLDRSRIQTPQILAHGDDVIRIGGIDLVDHEHIGHADIGLAGVIAALVARAMRVGDHNLKI